MCIRDRDIDKQVIKEEVYLPALKELLEKIGDVDEKELRKKIRLNREKLVVKPVSYTHLWWMILAIYIVLGLFIGILGSSISIKKYLKA